MGEDHVYNKLNNKHLCACSNHLPIRPIDQILAVKAKIIKVIIALPLKRFGAEASVIIDCLHFHKTSQPINLVKMKLHIIDEINPSSLFNNAPYAQV